MLPFSSVFHFISRTHPALTLIDLAGPSRLKLYSVKGLQLFGRKSSRSPPAEIPAWPGFCRLGEGMVRFAGCACLLVRSVVCFQSDTISAQNRLKRVCLVHHLPDQVCCQFSSGNGDQVPPFGSFSSVHSFQFTNSSGPHRDCMCVSVLKFISNLPCSCRIELWVKQSPSEPAPCFRRLQLRAIGHYGVAEGTLLQSDD